VRFSVVASLDLVVVGAAGLVLTVIVLDSPVELWSTPWGRLLMAKLVFVAVGAAAGGYNHRVLIPEMELTDSPRVSSRFRAVVTGEAVMLAGVPVLTALLVGAAS